MSLSLIVSTWIIWTIHLRCRRGAIQPRRNRPTPMTHLVQTNNKCLPNRTTQTTQLAKSKMPPISKMALKGKKTQTIWLQICKCSRHLIHKLHLTLLMLIRMLKKIITYKKAKGKTEVRQVKQMEEISNSKILGKHKQEQVKVLKWMLKTLHYKLNLLQEIPILTYTDTLLI